MEIIALGRLVVGTHGWRPEDREPRVTIIAKATFRLEHEAEATVVDPAPLTQDVFHESDPERSLRTASDFVPMKPRADLIFGGNAYAPVGERVRERRVRLALFRGDGTTALVDKSLRVLGERTRDESGKVSEPTPFALMPIRYELAYGGPASKGNPVGLGADPADPLVARIEHPTTPTRLACFGPISPTWWSRARAFGAGRAREQLAGGIVPAALDRAYFNSAPPDQQVPYLRGDEWIELEGLTPVLARVRSRLPGWVAHAALERRAEPRREIPLVLDTLRVDGDSLRVTATFRADVALADCKDATLVALLARVGEVAVWPDPDLARRAAPSELGPSTSSVGSEAPPATMALPEPESMVIGSASDVAKVVDATTAAKPAEGPPITQLVPPRTGEKVPVLGPSPLVAFTTHWQVSPPRDALVVIVKGTFSLVDGAPATLVEEQLPPSGDVHHDDDEKASLRYSTDFAIYKPAADLFLVGHARPTDARAGVGHVRLEVGEHAHAVAVFGDRTFATFGGASSPLAFDAVPLRWERSFGGASMAENPVGRGHRAGPAPNLERPDAMVTGASARVAPTGFGPIDASWRPRRDKLGTYDQRWLSSRWPYFPEDFDYGYFNAAPPELQVPYLRGDERWSIWGSEPGGRPTSGTLPGVTPRVFAQQAESAGALFAEIPLRLDTAWFDADARVVVLVWRGIVTVADDEASDVAALFTTLDLPGAEPITLRAAQAAFVAEVVKKNLVAPAIASTDAANAPAIPPPKNPPPPAKALSRATIEKLLAEGAPLAGRDLSGADLSALDLTGVDLTRAKLVGASMRGARLDRAKLAGAVLARADLTGASLAGCDAGAADFAGADLSDVDATGAELGRANLSRVRGERVLLDGARLSQAFLVHSELRGLSARRACFDQADLTGARLEGASFDEASFLDTKLYRAGLAHASFLRAKMAGARLDDADLVDAQLEDVDLAQASLARARLVGANLRRAQLKRAVLLRADATRANFTDASMVQAIARKARFCEAQMFNVDLMEATLEGADLVGARLRGANLYGVATWKARITPDAT